MKRKRGKRAHSKKIQCKQEQQENVETERNAGNKWHIWYTGSTQADG